MTSTTRKARGEYAKSGARRQEILQAAVEVFSGSGFHKGSLRDVADRVGLSQAGVLHHYPNKTRLLEAVLTWRDAETRKRMGDPPPKGVEMLRATLDVAKYNETTPELVELYATLSAEATSPDHPAHDYFIRRYAQVIEATRRAFEHAAVNGQVKPGIDCVSAARSLVALMDGLELQWLFDRDSVDMAAEMRRYLQSVLTVDL
ncbi:TetR/AcrR family transcriptional regulator [Streptomyces blattellae]|uniref:TetR/AcrR family transcriptional regulator n=1 Tax=Streptomyces blattellae TaxID=2569855 RepID=UPI001E37AE34|nr:TetR/AcrR family transcriptional regulator [Streptomyces blattellae]